MSLDSMINPFEQTPAEKEENVLDMIERGYGYPQIMKECHVSPNTISNIKKKYGGTTDNDGLQAGKTSKESQAFRLFQQAKSLLDVKTEVDIDSAEVIEYFRRYQELRGADLYNKGYEKVKGNITPYLQMFDLMNELGLPPEQVQEQVKYGYDLPRLQRIHANLYSQIQIMTVKHRYVASQLATAEKELQEYKGLFQFYDFQCEQKRNEIKSLDFAISRKKEFIRRLDDNEVGRKAKKSAGRKRNSRTK